MLNQYFEVYKIYNIIVYRVPIFFRLLNVVILNILYAKITGHQRYNLERSSIPAGYHLLIHSECFIHVSGVFAINNIYIYKVAGGQW